LLVRAAIRSAQDLIDSDGASAAWDHALQAPAWNGTPVWIHSDLLRPNLLVQDDRLGFAAPLKRTIEEILADLHA
jgi:aminoglycoside phosphotransferase (APT) family kinase protein